MPYHGRLVKAWLPCPSQFQTSPPIAAREKAGTPIGSMDLLIAAHTVSLGVTLATNNTREFSRVPGLTVIDWTA